ncbi:MAG: hypothetical protein ACU0E9_04700 [Limimaricola soesokkakensis]|uniref:hypothetical protein n=1 Tax=Limimaricola soesokkakensis TaxID=1343159 RepID=UPI0040583242
MPALSHRPPLSNFEEEETLQSLLPLPAIHAMVDAATEAYARFDPQLDTSGWDVASMRNAAIRIGAEMLAEERFIKFRYPSNLEVLRREDENLELNVYAGDKNVGTEKPGFASKRTRIASQDAAENCGDQLELFEVDERFGVVEPSRPGVSYLIMLIHVSKAQDGTYERRVQIAVNPRHNARHIQTAERLVAIDAGPWRDTSSSSIDPERSDDGGTGSPIVLERRHGEGGRA